MCLFPKLIYNRKYTANKKNKGVIPPLPLDKNGKPDKRVLYVPVGCGNCMECRKQKSRDWQVRLTEEIRHLKNGKFVTMTFTDESLIELGKGIKLKGYDLENAIVKKAVRRYLERWRKKYKKSVRHWLVTELGQHKTERIHLHGIIWSDEEEDIKKIWKYGKVDIGEYVNERTINYIVKYVNKADAKHKEYKPIVRASKGIGSKYLERTDKNRNKYKGEKTKETYQNRKGYKMALPIYYRNKIYTDEEREKLWRLKLDQETRYINGIKVDVSKNEDNYYKLLEEERLKNKRLGFGDSQKDWSRIKYENDRRNMLKEERLIKDWKKRKIIT